MGWSERGMANLRARELRQNPTIAEARLWRGLKQLRKRGYHFRRQVPIDGYIVDFACFGQRLVIEVDGVQHAFTKEAASDLKRDNHLRWQGFSVLRFSNGEVKENIDGVLLRVLAALGAVKVSEPLPQSLNSPPTPNPSPRWGRGTGAPTHTGFSTSSVAVSKPGRLTSAPVQGTPTASPAEQG